MSRVRGNRMTIRTVFPEGNVGRVAARTRISIRVARITSQLTCRIPNRRNRSGGVVARRGRTVAVRSVTHRRRLTVGHRSTERYCTVDVGRLVGSCMTLRTQRCLVLQMLIVSVRCHGSSVITVTLDTVRNSARGAPRVSRRARRTRRLINTVVVAKVRTATICRRVRKAHINSSVQVIVVARVVNVARRTTDRINTERARSVKVFRVVASTRIAIRVTQRTTGSARLPRCRVSTRRRVVARRVGTAVCSVNPCRYLNIGLVLDSCRLVSKGRHARDVCRIYRQRTLVTVCTVVAAGCVKVVPVIIR